MGRPPTKGKPAFRFTPTEVVEMETILQDHNNNMPAREVFVSLADKFSNSPERRGKILIQTKQIRNWFQNKRSAIRATTSKTPTKLCVSSIQYSSMELEARSAKDSAWYDVSAILSLRNLEAGDPEVLVRFGGFGLDEDEWINVSKNLRHRSIPCEASECVAVLPGDLILCFQDSEEQALYFDAHVLDAQRQKHDVRGCRCRFLVRYDHDQSEEFVQLRKICRRPETDYRLQLLRVMNELSAKQGNCASSTEHKTASSVDPIQPDVGLSFSKQE